MDRWTGYHTFPDIRTLQAVRLVIESDGPLFVSVGCFHGYEDKDLRPAANNLYVLNEYRFGINHPGGMTEYTAPVTKEAIGNQFYLHLTSDRNFYLGRPLLFISGSEYASMEVSKDSWSILSRNYPTESIYPWEIFKAAPVYVDMANLPAGGDYTWLSGYKGLMPPEEVMSPWRSQDSFIQKYEMRRDLEKGRYYNEWKDQWKLQQLQEYTNKAGSGAASPFKDVPVPPFNSAGFMKTLENIIGLVGKAEAALKPDPDPETTSPKDLPKRKILL